MNSLPVLVLCFIAAVVTLDFHTARSALRLTRSASAQTPAIAGRNTGAAQSAVVRFENSGTVHIDAVEPPNDQPTLVISDPRGRRLFSASLGEKSFPEQLAKPTMRFTIVRVPQQSSPLILAVARQTAGDGCRYDAVVVGETKRRFAALPVTPRLESHAWQEGLYLGDLGTDRGFGLAAWQPAFDGESVMDRHRYRVSLYRYDARRSEFARLGVLVSAQTYAAAEEALAELGLRYKNLAPLC